MLGSVANKLRADSFKVLGCVWFWFIVYVLTYLLRVSQGVNWYDCGLPDVIWSYKCCWIILKIYMIHDESIIVPKNKAAEIYSPHSKNK